MEMAAAHLDEALTLDQLAAEARLSTFPFAKMFRISFGLPPHRYLAARRIERAKWLLRTGQPLGEVALACGYGSQSHFNRTFKAATDRTPWGMAALVVGGTAPIPVGAAGQPWRRCASRRSAAGPDEAGFCPVISRPSATT
ncbi:Helix-turn-helix domain-containing protein [Methylobacterium phyllostachyos]|uniref:Helix-turn-helix domain-containing protein n=2 Tax=Methylobacterium phyllostachyos TaxID=582672 RepID=A0A1G9ZZ99_9HYPH|nr:Helix-turn-helix domain-containing protein [Methylobacterium phyllostachyos]